MKHQVATRLVLVLAFTATTIAFSAFSQKNPAEEKNYFRPKSEGYNDTTPPRKRNRIEDGELNDKIEQAMRNLEVQMTKLEEQMKKMDFSKMQKDIDASLSKVDFDKIGREIDVAMKKVDWDKVEKEVSQSIEKVKKVEMVKVKEELEKVKQQLEKEKLNIKLNDGKIKEHVEEAIEQAREGMQEARKSMEKAKVELGQLREFTNELQKDGLIDRKKGYRIEIKDGDLYLNDKQQPKEISDKYRKYFKKDNYTIVSEAEDKIRI
ncbi:MAG: hypothetical protein JWQ96_432 [Segetibacter sp.]|nr:hypothetical protein [Segetibacter sp.]